MLVDVLQVPASCAGAGGRVEQHTGWAAAMTQQQQQQQQLGPSVSVVDHDTLKSEVCISSSLPLPLPSPPVLLL